MKGIVVLSDETWNSGECGDMSMGIKIAINTTAAIKPTHIVFEKDSDYFAEYMLYYILHQPID